MLLSAFLVPQPTSASACRSRRERAAKLTVIRNFGSEYVCISERVASSTREATRGPMPGARKRRQGWRGQSHGSRITKLIQ